MTFLACSYLQNNSKSYQIYCVFLLFQTVKSGNKELHAMMNVNWTVATVPLLVMSCVATSSTPSESCAEVTELLQMTRLSRPWMVRIIYY